MALSSKLVVTVSDKEQQEIIIAWASMHEPDAIVESEQGLEIFLNDGEYDLLMETLLDKINLTPDKLSVVEVEDKNWNAEWESNFKPIAIDNIYIRAPFHEPSDAHEIDLIISPKMAFGTGHHETTYMMMQSLNEIDLANKTVMDYGCGTGILTVFAKMKGCGSITGIDIQEEAVENTFEHFELNNISTDDLIVRLGDLDQVKKQEYDIILANINRHVLLKNADLLREHMNEGGILLMSGILKVDRKKIVDRYNEVGFVLKGEKMKGEWCCFGFGA